MVPVIKDELKRRVLTEIAVFLIALFSILYLWNEVTLLTVIAIAIYGVADRV